MSEFVGVGRKKVVIPNVQNLPERHGSDEEAGGGVSREAAGCTLSELNDEDHDAGNDEKVGDFDCGEPNAREIEPEGVPIDGERAVEVRDVPVQARALADAPRCVELAPEVHLDIRAKGIRADRGP